MLEPETRTLHGVYRVCNIKQSRNGATDLIARLSVCIPFVIPDPINPVWLKILSELPSANLLVIRSSDMHRAVTFYNELGMKFVLHAHGHGPEHYASETVGFVFEIYPQRNADDKTNNTRLGFRVSDLDGVLGGLRELGATILKEPKDTEWGRQAVVKDFDGHTVELLTTLHRESEFAQNSVWVFNGAKAIFPSAVFTSREIAEKWIHSSKVQGTLTLYPLDISTFNYAVEKGWFNPKLPGQLRPEFIQRFTSASQEHYHYESSDEDL